MHALSLPTWWIHTTSVLEWLLAILVLQRWSYQPGQRPWRWLALAMVPALVSAMAACTWHLYDNAPELYGLVVLQAFTTLVGNIAMAAAAWRIASQPQAPL